MKIPFLNGTFRTVIKADSLREFSPRYRKTDSSFKDIRDSHVLRLQYQDARPWFFNDHCFFEDQNGLLHLFGINNPYPEDDGVLYQFHPFISHFVTNDPLSGWQPVGFALDESSGTEYLGAPFVFRHHQGGYRMILESLRKGVRILEMAESADLYDWKRLGEPLFEELGYTKRDPCVVYEKSTYRIYLCNPRQGKSVITLAETDDFRKFRYTDVLSIDDGSGYGGIESPFVLKHENWFYLFFTYAHRQYYETIVVPSDRHDSFSMDNCLTTLFGHASEIFAYNGVFYFSSAGPEDYQELNDHGIKLVELKWK